MIIELGSVTAKTQGTEGVELEGNIGECQPSEFAQGPCGG